MKRIYISLILSYLLILSNFKLEAQQDSTSNAGILFHRSNYSSATKVLEKQLDVENNALDYYNLALCYNKLGNTYRAILAIERSQYLDPYNPKTREVLPLLYEKSKGLCRYERGIMLSLADKIIYSLYASSWKILALGSFILSMLLIIAYFYFKSSKYQRMAFYSSILLALSSVFCNLALAHQYYYHKEVEHIAIVTKECKAYSDAYKGSKMLTKLYEGNRLSLEENPPELEESWQMVKLPNEQIAYVQKSVITSVVEGLK